MELKFINFKNFMFKNSYLWYIWRARSLEIWYNDGCNPGSIIWTTSSISRTMYAVESVIQIRFVQSWVGLAWAPHLLFPATFSVQFILIIKIKFVITWLHGELNIDTLRMWEWWGNKGGTAEWLQLQSSNQLFKNVLENQWMGQEQDI